jgi:hypothetical protein
MMWLKLFGVYYREIVNCVLLDHGVANEHVLHLTHGDAREHLSLALIYCLCHSGTFELC